MPLSASEKLGSYEILSAFGAGGMGKVSKARDTRLDRTATVEVSGIDRKKNDPAERVRLGQGELSIGR